MHDTDKVLIERFRKLISELTRSDNEGARAALVDETRFDPWIEKSHNWSERWLISMSLGPWTISRTEGVRDLVLQRLHKRHLEDLSEAQICALGFPLEWQTRYTAALAAYLQHQRTTLRCLCGHLKKCSGLEARGILRAATGLISGQSKCIDYFVREALELDVFPIDRWVRRLLSKHGLPTSQEQLIRLSYATGHSPRLVARSVYLHGSGN